MDKEKIADGLKKMVQLVVATTASEQDPIFTDLISKMLKHATELEDLNLIHMIAGIKLARRTQRYQLINTYIGLIQRTLRQTYLNPERKEILN